MTLNELSRYHWARMNQAMYIDGALTNFEMGGTYEYGMWYCLLQWVYHMDIADEINDAHGFAEWLKVTEQTRGYFV